MSTIDAHYETLVEDRGYERPSSGLGGLSAGYVGHRFACADGGRAFARAIDRGDPALVTFGISTTGPPHVGTLGQVLTAIECQAAGLDVQLVIADLAAYNAAGRDLERVRSLAAEYVAFAERLGFDPDRGTLRTQEDARDVMHSWLLLSRYFDPDEESEDPEPTAFEAALDRAYDEVEAPGTETPRFAGEQTSLSLVADSLHPVMKQGYGHVALAVGADNAGLPRLFRRVLDRSPYEASISGLYTRLVPGLDGYPKMSKSLPGSRISLGESPDSVREGVRSAGDSLVLEAMRVASEYSPAELDRIRESYPDGEEWSAARETYADYLAGMAAEWGE